MKERGGNDPHRGNDTILLVDDEPIAIELLQEMLGQFGYAVMTADNGERAIEVYRCERDRIALVILDLNMPQMSGSECLKRLFDVDPGVKVIISSGYSTVRERTDLFKSGAVAFLRKPYTLEELLHRVEEILHAR